MKTVILKSLIFIISMLFGSTIIAQNSTDVRTVEQINAPNSDLLNQSIPFDMMAFDHTNLSLVHGNLPHMQRIDSINALLQKPSTFESIKKGNHRTKIVLSEGSQFNRRKFRKWRRKARLRRAIHRFERRIKIVERRVKRSVRRVKRVPLRLKRKVSGVKRKLSRLI